MKYSLTKVISEGYKPFAFYSLRSKIFRNLLGKFLFKPIYIYFNITDNCNSRCTTCSSWKQKSENELTTEEIFDVLQQLRDINARHIGFAGGEPLLRRDLEDIIVKAKELNFENISVLSNGLSLSANRAERLLAAGLSEIGLSIDGLNEKQDQIRGVKGYYNKSIRALESVNQLRQKQSSFGLKISTTLMKQSLPEFDKIFSLCEKYDAKVALNLVDTNPYFFQGVNADDFWVKDQKALNNLVDLFHERKNLIAEYQSHESLEYIRHYFKDPVRKDIKCILGYLSLGFGPHGEVYSGCWVLKPIGNIREKKLKDILYSEEYRKRLYQMYEKNCPGCSCSYTSNVSYDLKSLFREIVWQFKYSESKKKE